MRAFDENMNEFEMEGEGLLARAFCHELIIWTENCMLNWQKTDFMKCLMMKKIKTMRKEGRMRIIFMGTPDFRSEHWKRLWKQGHDVCLAVTQPDKPKGRGKEMQFTPVKEAAVSMGFWCISRKECAILSVWKN